MDIQVPNIVKYKISVTVPYYDKLGSENPIEGSKNNGKNIFKKIFEMLKKYLVSQLGSSAPKKKVVFFE